jgi:DNA-binding transcriptional ArsR family regulator
MTLAALADPTRLKLFEKLRKRPCSVQELTDFLEVSQPAVSQHLKVLREARLVRSEARGTKRFYELDLAGLATLREYLDRVWIDVLTAHSSGVEKSAG